MFSVVEPLSSLHLVQGDFVAAAASVPLDTWLVALVIQALAVIFKWPDFVAIASALRIDPTLLDDRLWDLSEPEWPAEQVQIIAARIAEFMLGRLLENPSCM